jgi:endonuclease/exonuclease/phosphatase family metal-dependent hydrolase
MARRNISYFLLAAVALLGYSYLRRTQEFTAPKGAEGPLTELSVLTWNVWFDRVEYRRRMEHILLVTLEKRPDVACFQEVLQEFADMVSGHPLVRELYHVSPFASPSYGVLTMVKKIHNAKFSFVDFPTSMGRELLKASFEKDQHRVEVGNVHLESLSSERTRAEQLRICAKELGRAPLSLLVGDFNFCSERNFRQIPGAPLENEVLKATLPDFVDLWKHIARPSEAATKGPDENEEQANDSTPKKGTGRRVSLESALQGYTFDSLANPMITHEERMRYDRIMVKLGESRPPHPSSLSLLSPPL